MYERLSDRLVGRWTEILPLVGVPVQCLNGKNQPCPLCGGKDRFRMFKRNEGAFICTHCGSMNGIALAMRLTGRTFTEVARKVDSVIGTARPAQREERTDFDKRKSLNEVWRRSKALAPSTPAWRYLARRTGMASFPPCLRAVDELRYHDTGHTKHFYPAMLAMVTGPDDKPENIYRTYLTRDGRKADLDPPRRMMPGTVPKGSAVRLGDSAQEMGVAEGIETALSAAFIHGVPVWAVLGTAGLASWVPPEGVERVFIFGDNDLGYGGQAAAYAAGFRLSALPGRKLNVEVLIPGHKTNGRDWNDEARDQEGAR